VCVCVHAQYIHTLKNSKVTVYIKLHHASMQLKEQCTLYVKVGVDSDISYTSHPDL